MTVAALNVLCCNMGLSEICLRHAVSFEAERACRNAFCRSLRFNNFMPLCLRSKHKLPEKYIKAVDGYEKESVCSGIDHLVGTERTREEIISDLIRKNYDIKVNLACEKFPSINLGYFPSVGLYDESTCYSETIDSSPPQVLEGYFPSRVDINLVDPNSMYNTPDSVYAEISDMSTYVVEEKINESTISYPSQDPKSEPVSPAQVTADKPSSNAGSEIQHTDVSVAEVLDKDLKTVTGLNKRHLGLLENSGLHTLRKLLHHFPRTYVDMHNADVEIEDGQYLIFVGKVTSSRGIRASCSFSFLEVIVVCEVTEAKPESESTANDCEAKRKRTLHLHLKKFFRGTRFTYAPFLKSIQEKHKEGDTVCVSGKVRAMRNKDHFEMREYNIDLLKGEEDSGIHEKRRVYPIYPSKKGLNAEFIRDVIARALKTFPVYLDPLPKEITKEFGLLSLSDAYIGIHQPTDLNKADLARRRLIFDEFFYIQLGRLYQMLEGLGTQLERDGLLQKYTKPEFSSASTEDWSSLTKEFAKALPYVLTASQLRATSEIIWDLKRPVPMNRLLQGDVGCGKTVVAFLTCMEVIASGYQAAFMVPSELLAIQHYENLLGLLHNLELTNGKPSVALLTGSTPSKQAQFIRKGLQNGDISLVIGTHSLIAEKVEFSFLRIAIVDEQHRFGVVQRGLFNSKLYFNKIASELASTGPNSVPENDIVMAPHVLAMSATPIPRSLALALYGDMSLTQITDIPPGRTPVKTYLIEGNDNGFEKVYQMMMEELEGGGKVYLVYPTIDQSEQLPQLRAASADLETISKKFPNYTCGLLHGRMKGDVKDEALSRFRTGETKILLSTQVIEIGVDVPDASMMVVMNAERFGIAQLHQLRGRVGRGERKSKCILLSSTITSLNRLKVLEKSSDGFSLASMDLLLRGPGDLLGKKQSGHIPEFPVARLEIDGDILQEAHLAALKVLAESHDLAKFPDLKAELSMRQPLCLLGD